MEIGGGWIEYFDDLNRLPYYYHEQLKITQWENPLLLPSAIPDDQKNIETDDMDQYSDMDSNGDDENFNPSVPVSELKFIDDSEVPRNRSKTEIIGGQTVDYLHLARDYRLQRPYTDPVKQILCSLCKINNCTDVFFPCEHRCVCPYCIDSESFCPDFKMKETDGAGFCNCPICAEVIKLILPHEGGREVEKYWKWVLEVKPPLPSGFVRSFHHSEGAIRKIFINDPEKIIGKPESGACSIS